MPEQAPAPAADAAPVVTEPENGNDAAPAAAAPAEPKADSGVVTFLQTELKAAQKELLDANVALKEAQAKITSMETTHNGLVKIAAASVRNMKVALGMTAVDYSGMSAEQVLAEHASATEAFQKAFKAGGVAAVNAPEPAPEAKLDPHYKARIAATRTTAN